MKKSYRFVFSTDVRDWDEISTMQHKTCYHTKEWANYLQSIYYKTHVICIYKEDDLYGYFLYQRRGIGRFSILASPYEGLGTYSQGLITREQISKENRIYIYSIS